MRWVDRDSAVGIATRYGLDGPGMESWWRDFPLPSWPVLGPTSPPIRWVPGLFPGGKRTGAWRWPPTSSSAEVKESVELYLCSPFGTSWPVLGKTLPIPLPLVGKVKSVWRIGGVTAAVLKIGIRWLFVVSFMSSPFYTRLKSFRNPLNRRPENRS